MANVKDIHPGDKVQIKIGAKDITNNKIATHVSKYIEGGALWGTVESVSNFYGKTKVRVYTESGGKNVVVWQVEPDGIANNIIHPEMVIITEPKPIPAIGKSKVEKEAVTVLSKAPQVQGLFTTTEHALSWKPPANTKQTTTTQIHQTGSLKNELALNTLIAETSMDNKIAPVKFKKIQYDVNLSDSGATKIKLDNSIMRLETPTAASDKSKLAEMLNDNKNVIQNNQAFPNKISSANYKDYIPASYDYRIETGPTSLGANKKTRTLEESMTELRAALGIPVHGDNAIAKYMRYFLYNRFKTPDPNLAHNKSFTHVFFTRPDLNILERRGQGLNAAAQCLNHTESAMLWMRNPALFKLLVDKRHCNDSNNFNMLLSNAASSFQIEDETIGTNTAGKSWNEYSMQYGNTYTGRSAGEFSVSFTDDKYYSIINLLKLWVIYIDNVSRGAWSPSYSLNENSMDTPNINNSHVYTKTLDYAASVYVLKTGEDGSDLLYWTKYYGVFPVNTGANALSWNSNNSPGDAPRLDIRFKYSFKRDLSPISLLEFNNCSGLPGSWDSLSRKSNKTVYETQFNTEYAHSARPYVGVPFIQMKMPLSDPTLIRDAIDKRDYNLATLRLQFMNRPDVIGFKDNDLFGYKIK
jgi:hypothetical protein